MTTKLQVNHCDLLATVHPFPARMAPNIVWNNLRSYDAPLTILDPMCGSGTSLVTSRMFGHKAIGFDTDPLAILISKVWSSDIDQTLVYSKAEDVLQRALKFYRGGKDRSYPASADSETKVYIRYWFDQTARKQLIALSTCISGIRDDHIRTVLWCAFSRMIITKKIGVSLAMDISHSRPHRVYDQAPVRPWDRFLPSVERVLKSIPFIYSPASLPRPRIAVADARKLPLRRNSVDIVVTSPPYLNAIDYVRGHKLSLVWMGYNIAELRSLRSSNVGTEVLAGSRALPSYIEEIMDRITDCGCLDSKHRGMLVRYLFDLEAVMSEIHRVLKVNGQAIIVIGDSAIRKVFVKNSSAIIALAEKKGLSLVSKKTRRIPDNRRYLPPPASSGAGVELSSRMKEEVILKFQSIPSTKC